MIKDHLSVCAAIPGKDQLKADILQECGGLGGTTQEHVMMQMQLYLLWTFSFQLEKDVRVKSQLQRRF